MKLKSYPKLVISSWIFVLGLFIFAPQVRADTVYYLHQDHLGSTSLVTNEQGEVISQQVYYPYGTTRAKNGPQATERQYTGQVSDTDQTGLYYYNARYYNPTIAKFTQADSLNDQLNRYSYVRNNPLKFMDPTGNLVFEDRQGKPQDYLIQQASLDIFSSVNEIKLLKRELRYPDPVPLTHWGENARQLYLNYKNTPGWWNNFKAGTMSEAEFFELILSYELGPFANLDIRNLRKFRADIAEASTHWYFSKCEFEKGSECSQATNNAFFNWLGGASESLQRRWRETYLTKDGMMKKFDSNTLLAITPQYGRNADLAKYVHESIVNPPDPSWTQTKGKGLWDKPFYWGNETMFGQAPTEYVWKFGGGSNAWYVVTLGQKYKFK